MLYLEAELAGHGHLGAAQPAYGSIVTGIQVLDPSVADDVLTLFASRYPVPSSSPAPAEGVFNFMAVTAERLAALGYSTSQVTKNAADYIKDAVAAGSYALADVNDVATLETTKSVGDFHFSVAGKDAVPYIAGAGSNLSVLSPLPNAQGAAAPKSMLGPILGAAAGAGIGALVGGGIGALVGGVGGYIVVNMAQK